jgi:hypothetical protein
MTEAAQGQPASFRAGIVSHQHLFRSLLSEHLSSYCGATVAFECATWGSFAEQASVMSLK